VQMKHIFFFFHITQNKFCINHIPPHQTWLLMTNSAVLHWCQSSADGPDHLLQPYAPHYSLQSRYNLAISSHLLPSSAIWHSYRDGHCQQQQRCLLAAHNQQHCQAPIQEFV
jgi:hypothetical protein